MKRGYIYVGLGERSEPYHLVTPKLEHL